MVNRQRKFLKQIIMKKFLYSIFAVLLVACNQNDILNIEQEKSSNEVHLTKAEYLSITRDGSNELSEDEIEMFVSNFLDEISKNEKTTRTSVPNYTLNISSKYYYVPKDTTVLTRATETFKLPIYELELHSKDGNGIIYFSADERNPEIIALIPKAAIDEDVFIQSGSAFLIEWAKMSSYEKLLEVEENRKLLCDRTVKRICEELSINESDFDIDKLDDNIVVEQSYTRARPINMPTTQIVSMCEPIVKTEWSQGSPYNLSLPAPNPPSTQAHVYTGCAVTAACQMMTAIKPNLTLDGITIDWEYLTETPTISSSASQDKLEMLGKLHSWVFEQLDAQPNYNTSGYHTSTGVTANSQVWFYGNYFNHSEDYSKYDPDALLRSFNAGRPSLIRGQGHAWIVDGFIICQKDTEFETSKIDTRAQIVKYYDMYWHANLGWGGTANGYYKLNSDTHVDFEASGYLFTTDGLYVYPGLYKKTTNFNF